MSVLASRMGSGGRATASYATGQEFKSVVLHAIIPLAKSPKRRAQYIRTKIEQLASMKIYDPRAIANLMLDEADQRIEITNLALQKLLYFAHGIYLTQTKKPLVSGYFEAWQYGPVHPSAYRAFKSSGSAAITMRAEGKDPLTGRSRPIPRVLDYAVIDLVRHVLRSYGTMSPGRLVDLSHAKGSPWDYIVDKSRTSIAFGLQIPDTIIKDRFRYHKVSIGLEPNAGEPSDDTPFA